MWILLMMVMVFFFRMIVRMFSMFVLVFVIVTAGAFGLQRIQTGAGIDHRRFRIHFLQRTENRSGAE